MSSDFNHLRLEQLQATVDAYGDLLSKRAQERISLGQLRKLADGLDCELVYALVPRKPLSDVVLGRAQLLAKEEVYGVSHTMSLENQRPTDERIQKQVTRRAEDLLQGKWSNLWR